MKHQRLLTIAAMICVIAASLLTFRNYIFNERNDFGGFIFPSTTVKIWNESSPANYNFCPVLTYNNSGDKFITYYKRLEDREGNNYFVSQPPFSCIFAYGFFKLFHLSPSAAAFRILNLVLLIAGSMQCYMIVNICSRKKMLDFSLPALSAMTVYLFIPVNIFFTAANYAPGFFFWLSGMLLFLFIVMRQSVRSYFYILLGISVFLATYTDWIGLFFSISLVFYCLFHFRDNRNRKIAVYVASFSLAALLVTFLQFASLNGTAEMIHAMKLRFLSRTGLFGGELSELGIHVFSIKSWLIFLKKLHVVFIEFGYLAILLGLFLWFRRKDGSMKNKIIFAVFCASILPVIIHFIVLFNSNAIHMYYLVKLSIPIALLTGLFCEKLNQNPLFKTQSAVVFLVIVPTAASSVFIAEKIFPITENYSVPEKQGIYIQKNAMPDEAVFISRDTASHFFADFFLTYLSNRNLMYADDSSHAAVLAAKFKKQKGVYFELIPDTSKCIAYHFTVNTNNKNQ